MKSMIACIDSARFDNPVVQTAVALARQHEARVYLIHISAMGVLISNGVRHDGSEPDPDAWARAWRELRDLQRWLLAQGVDAVTVVPDDLSTDGMATAIGRLNVEMVLMPEPRACEATERVLAR